MEILGKMLYVLALDCMSRPVLRAAVAARTLPQVLGGQLAGAKVNGARTEMLNRLYNRLSDAQQFRCRATMLECRAARRAHLFAGLGSRGKAEYVA